MRRNLCSSRSIVAAAAVLILAVGGCFSSNSHQTPSDLALEALEATLKTWKAGANVNSLLDRKPPVHAIDSEWKAGKPLSDFEVGDQTELDGNRQFQVKLKREKQQDVETRYFVVGLDPIWVYRSEDYDRLINMDDNPKAGSTKKRPPSRAAR